MIRRSTLALSIAIAALSSASMAFAQTREIFGPVLPMIYDGQGGRHYCLYGYDGPFDPPMPPAAALTTLLFAEVDPRLRRSPMTGISVRLPPGPGPKQRSESERK